MMMVCMCVWLQEWLETTVLYNHPQVCLCEYVCVCVYTWAKTALLSHLISVNLDDSSCNMANFTRY